MRRLRTAEIIHRFDDALGHYNLKHNTKLTWKESDTGIEVGDKNLEFKSIESAMHLSSRKRNKWLVEVLSYSN